MFLVLTRRPTCHIQSSLELGLVVGSESPQSRNKFRVVSLEVRVVEIMTRPSDPGGIRAVFDRRIAFPEAVQVELTDKAGEVAGFEGVAVVRGGAGGGRQDLLLEEPLIDDEHLAEAVPADGFVGRVVHQTPQLGGEVNRVDALRE